MAFSCLVKGWTTYIMTVDSIYFFGVLVGTHGKGKLTLTRVACVCRAVGALL
jgi:hypothetical protein